MKTKRILSILLIFVMVLSLSSCKLSEKEQIEKEKNETEAELYMQDYLSQKYGKFKISSIEGLTYIKTDIFPAKYLSDYCEIDVTVDKKHIKFLLNSVSKTLYSNESYETINNEYKNVVYNALRVHAGDAGDVNIYVNTPTIKLQYIAVSDNTIDDVFNNKETYRFASEIYYRGKFIDLSKVNTDDIFTKTPIDCVRIGSYRNNCEDISSGNASFVYTKELLIASCENGIIEKRYSKYQNTEINGVIFCYNPDYYEVIASDTSIPNSVPKMGTYYKDKRFVSTGDSAQITFRKIKELKSVDWNNVRSDDAFESITSSGILIHNTIENAGRIFVYSTDSHIDEYLNIREEESMDRVYGVNNLITSIFPTENKEKYTYTIDFYEDADKQESDWD